MFTVIKHRRKSFRAVAAGYLIDENFDDNLLPSDWTFTSDVSPGNSYTVSGGLLSAVNGSDYVTFDVPAAMQDEFWVKALIDNVGGTNSKASWHSLIEVLDSSSVEFIKAQFWGQGSPYGSGTYRLDGATTVTSLAQSIFTSHYVWFHFVKNGTSELWVSQSSTRPTTDSTSECVISCSTNNTSADKIKLMLGYANGARPIYWDFFIGNDTDPDAGVTISTTNLIFHVDASSVASYDSTQSPQPTTWTDLSGSGNDLDLTGTAGPPLYEDTSGIESLEFEQDQNEHGIFTGSPENVPDIGGNEVTFNVWWKEESATQSSIIWLNSSTTSATNAYRQLNVHLGWSNTVYFDCGADTTYDRISKSTSGVTMTDWHMWTFTKNASTGSMKIYLDGAEWHSDTGKTKAITTPVAGSIGRRVVGSTSDYQVDGRVGEIQLYDAELSAATILSNYNATNSKYNI